MKKADMKKSLKTSSEVVPTGYPNLVSEISELLEQARRTTVRTVNSTMTVTYWAIGRRIVEFEQRGKERAEYGEGLLKKLAADLTKTCGRGFGWRNLFQMRAFYLAFAEKLQTASAISQDSALLLKGEVSTEAKLQTVSAIFPSELRSLSAAFPLPWSAYVRLLSVKNDDARRFYEKEAILGGWSVRQLDRQISTQFYERALHSKNPDALLAPNRTPRFEDVVPIEAEIRDPYLLEFLNLKDEYSETELEDALIRHLEWFLLEMGAGFTFVARQKRIRIGNSWYRVDLLLYHRGLRCLVIVDLKRGRFTHGDAGQMNLYLNYARENMMLPGEAEPVGIIFCSDKDDAVVKYATGGIQTRVFASKYLTDLPDEETLRQEILSAQRAIQARLKEGTIDE